MAAKHDRRVLRNLRALAASLPATVAGAMSTELEIEMAEMKRRTPVDTGALRSSGFVADPVHTPGEISVTLGFGGPAAPYAVYVHENLSAFHPVGEAKFLESVLTESLPFLPRRIARRIDLAEAVPE